MNDKNPLDRPLERHSAGHLPIIKSSVRDLAFYEFWMDNAVDKPLKVRFEYDDIANEFIIKGDWREGVYEEFNQISFTDFERLIGSVGSDSGNTATVSAYCSKSADEDNRNTPQSIKSEHLADVSIFIFKRHIQGVQYSWIELDSDETKELRAWVKSID